VLFALAGCGGALKVPGGGQAGSGGGSITTGQGGAGIGTGAGATGVAGGPLQCPRAPATNDAECHPEDTGLWSAGFAVPALGGECTPGRTCEIPVGLNNDCARALGLQTFVCCAAIIPDVTADSLAPLHSGWVPGWTIEACPQPTAGQDPACALPLAATCPTDGLTCSYQSAFGAGADAGCLQCGGTHDYTIRCCGGAWTLAAICPADAGMD